MKVVGNELQIKESIENIESFIELHLLNLLHFQIL